MNQMNDCPCCGEEASEEELLARVDKVIEQYRDKPGALIPVLQMTQSIMGYLPESALKRISLGLGKSYSEVAGVTGFYSFFSTVPRGQAPGARLSGDGVLCPRRQAWCWKL